MCEFKVFLDGDQVLDEVLYAKAKDGRIVLRDVIGTEKVFEGAEIVEVNVIGTRLILIGNVLPCARARRRSHHGANRNPPQLHL